MIGFRIPWSQDIPKLPELAQWAAGQGFGAIDIGGADPAAAEAVRGAGLQVGTFDLKDTALLLSPDPEQRRAGVVSVTEQAARAADLGLGKAFGVFLPADNRQSRADSFLHWSEGWPAASAALAEKNIAFTLEGWPGGGPHYPALGVTPETVRPMLALDAARGAGALKLNYDPSHLIRLGVDPLRFLSEFGSSVRHAHGKDTAFDPNRLYETGNLGYSLPAASVPGFGEGWWRYCIPGDGAVSWAGVAAGLSEHGFDGIVSVELEDARYNGTWGGEQKGLLRSFAYLSQYF